MDVYFQTALQSYSFLFEWTIRNVFESDNSISEVHEQKSDTLNL